MTSVFFNSPISAVAHFNEGGNHITIMATLTQLQFLNVGLPGPPGLPGLGSFEQYSFPLAATWIGSHSRGRPVDVSVFLDNGEKVIADVVSTPINFTITHGSPQTGFALIG